MLGSDSAHGTNTSGLTVSSSRTLVSAPLVTEGLCEEIGRFDFTKTPLNGQIITPVVKIKKVDLYKYIIAASLDSSPVILSLKRRDFGARTWQQQIVRVEDSNFQIDLSNHVPGELILTVDLRPKEPGTLGDIALYRYLHPAVANGNVTESITVG